MQDIEMEEIDEKRCQDERERKVADAVALAVAHAAVIARREKEAGIPPVRSIDMADWRAHRLWNSSGDDGQVPYTMSQYATHVHGHKEHHNLTPVHCPMCFVDKEKQQYKDLAIARKLKKKAWDAARLADSETITTTIESMKIEIENV
jgi:hypothetical protein